MSRKEIDLVASVALTDDDIKHVEVGAVSGRFDAVAFAVTSAHQHGDTCPHVSICFMGLEGEHHLSNITLQMAPEQARLLAEAILANGVVSPERN